MDAGPRGRLRREDRTLDRRLVRSDHGRSPPSRAGLSDLGILALTRTYGAARVDAACRRGVSIKARSVTSLRSILQNGLDRTFLDDGEQGEREPVRHGNIRGRDYFH